MADNNQHQTVKNQRMHHLDLQLAKTSVHIENVEKDLFTRYNLKMEELDISSLELDKSSKVLINKMKNLKIAVEQAKAINMASIEEYDKQKMRFNFLKDQIEDIDKSKQELLKIVHDLDSKCRSQFKSIFDKIRACFIRNFQILFSGGEANLILTETQDILEAGIEIIVQPPGKQMKSINLLSGGEKCLTAIALLFALFEVKSVPFCFLD